MNEKLANNVLLTLAARFMSVIGVPVALWILYTATGAFIDAFIDMRDAIRQQNSDLIRFTERQAAELLRVVEKQALIDAEQNRRIMTLEKKP